MGKEDRYYIKNADFLADLKRWKESGDENIPDYIAEYFVKLANNIISRWNFSNYTYKEDMVGHALLTCIRYSHNFDVNHPASNPYAYFSQYIWNAYRQILNREKSLHDFKKEMIEETVTPSLNRDHISTHNRDSKDQYIDREFTVEDFSEIQEEYQKKKKKEILTRNLMVMSDKI